MSLDQQRPPMSYDEIGAHRHLVVSERLRARRRELGLTQKEVVARLRRLGVNTTNKHVSSLEHGAGLDVGKLPEIACALECSLTYLVGLTETPTSWIPDGPAWAATTAPSAPYAPETPRGVMAPTTVSAPAVFTPVAGYPPILAPLDRR